MILRNTSASRRRQGMALVIVLGIIALLAILVVGFLVRSGTERTSASSYAAMTNAQQLSDIAVNLVQAQINQATSLGTDKAWISQPGAVRVFSDTGALDKIFRLYSAQSLEASSASDLQADVPPASWATQPAVWVDLNRPAKLTDSTGASHTHFPVLDPRSPSNLSQTATIEGFSLDSPPGATAEQPAPMPVRWLYVLQNGELVSPTGSGKTVTVSGATKQNPIVGRIAFWADDDTSKVNVNTASDGSFWDVPRFDAPDDRGLAKFQPAAREYQRYPGHPATTTLKKVFPDLSTEQIFALTPRYINGGSRAGTIVPGAQVDVGTSRLYPSVGELLLNPGRSGQGLSRQQLETSRFFVTARSRAPEINLFGKPRISIWPIHQTNDATRRTPNDGLMAFCSSSAGSPYYFTRIDPTDAVTDITLPRNSALLGYLDRLTGTAIPGFGGNFGAKYGADEKRQVLTQIFDYVRTTNLVDSSGSSGFLPYAHPAPAQTNPIGKGQVVPATHTGWGTRGFGRYYQVIEASMVFACVGQGKVGTTNGTVVDQRQIPPYPGTNGAGMPPDDTRAIQAYFVLNFFDPSNGWSGINPDFTVQVEGLSAFGLNGTPLEMPSSAALYLGRNDTGGSDLASLQNYRRFNGGRPYGGLMDFRVMVAGRRFGSDPATQFPFYSKIVPVPVSGSSPTMTLDGAVLTVRLYNGNSVAPADLVQEYRLTFPPGSGTPETPVPFALPVPTLSSQRIIGAPTVASNPGSPVDRFDFFRNSDSRTRIIDVANDVVLSLVPTANAGDYRLLARDVVPASMFQAHPSAGGRLAYGFSLADGNTFSNSSVGSLVSGAPYITSKKPLVPATVTNAVAGGVGTAPGDWDTGLPLSSDGPYIGKPDEGNILSISTATPYFDTPASDTPLGASFFSPNRQVASPVAFGSLPTGVKSTRPWQTLLFRPGPGGHQGEANQPTSGSPADHLLLDLFWMPVVEPYAISEPFSTAGKVNLNYQIVPFNYITRNTALRSVLASTKTAKVSLNQPRGTAIGGNARLPLNLSEDSGTLRQFKEKFAAGNVFKSASEICDIFLVPQGEAWTSDSAARTAWYGNDYAMVGDNVRERPYSELYSRLTTRSNTFTVHYLVEVLKNPPVMDPATWDEDRGVILGTYQGSTTLERYIDPNDPKLQMSDYDFVGNSSARSLETLYKWRVIENHRFAP